MSSSPYHVRRVEEKEELQSLNTRLESYVLHAKDIAAERDRLAVEVSSMRKRFQQERRELVERYESTVTELREEVSETSASLATCETTCEELRRENKLLKSKLAGMEELRRERDSLAAEVDPLKAELEELKAELRRVTRLSKEQQKEITTQTRTINTLRARNESRGAELKSLQSQLDDFEGKTAAEMQALRDVSAANLQTAREEWERMNSAKMAKVERDLKEKFDKETADMHAHNSKLREQVDRLSAQLSELKRELKKKSEYAAELIQRLTTVEEESHSSDFNDRIRALEKEISSLHGQLLEKEDEFNDLMDIKISLEAEIEHYRSILEVEETRVGLSPSSDRRKLAEADDDDDGDDAAAAAVATSTVVVRKSTKVTKSKSKSKSKGGRRKSTRSQKRVSSDEKTTESGADKRQRTLTCTVTKSTQLDFTNGIDLELDLIADTVKITNNTGDELDMEGWTLTSDVGSNQKFTFPEGVVLSQGQSTTVYSGKGADQHHRPPHHLFWTKRFIWNNDGDSATLLDVDGNQVQHVTGEPLALDEVDDALKEGDKDNCTIM